MKHLQTVSIPVRSSSEPTISNRSFESHLADSPDVLISRFLVEAEILVEAETNVVTIQTVDKLLEMQQMLLQGTSDGRLVFEALIRVLCAMLRRLTLPLALSPVNQMVTPFWPSSSILSVALTEPVGVADQRW